MSTKMASSSFAWKRKKTTISRNKLFGDTDEDAEEEEIDWLDPFKRIKTSNVISLEDATSKSIRLKNEGITLADNERHWEAIKKWDEAVKLSPTDETLHEMMAQVYLALNELTPAVKAAENCVKTNPRWWIGFQTLGRTFLGIGEVKLAIKSFSKAIYLQPDVRELWEDDLNWACSLLEQHKQMITNENSTNFDENDEKSLKIDVKSRKWVRLRN